MKNLKDDIKTLIVVLIVCTVCVSLVLILNIKKNYDKLDYVNDYNEFFSISNCINNYINYLSNKNSDAVFSLLDTSYTTNNLIDTNNVLNTINYEQDVSVSIKELKYTKVKENIIYYIKASLYKNTFTGSTKLDETFEALILLDLSNSSYSIIPIDNNLKTTINNIKSINIENNQYNKIQSAKNISKEKICSLYLSSYLSLLYDDTEKAYDMASDSMKEKYSTIDSFKKFAIDNVNIMSSTAYKCKQEEINDKRVYYVYDSNNNKYKFEEENIMNYKTTIYINNEKV